MTTVLDQLVTPKAELNARGTWTIKGLKVFRAGKMKDSKGIQRQWEHDHLDMMIQNFDHLRTAQIFSDVPVRADHSISVRNVVGYFEGVRREGDFIVADLEITEQDAADKWNRRTWRARSLEVGAYETNDEAVYWPAILGVAFVDIGAVEGLHRQGSPDTPPLATFSQLLVDDDKETHVPTPEEEAAAKAAAEKAAADAKTAADAQVAADKVAADAKAAADKAAADAKDAADKVAADAAAKAAADQAAAAAAAAQKAAADKAAADAAAAQAAATYRAGGTQTFRFGGEDVADPAEVQRRIDSALTFQREQVDAGRTTYVESLATANKIAATQKDTLIAFAKSLTDEQFVKFKEGYDNAPTLSLFSPHGSPAGGTPPGAPTLPASMVGDNRTPEQIKADLVEVVNMHRRTGMPTEALHKTESYRKLSQLDPAGYPA